MTKEEWIRISHKMREPLQELARIAAQAQVETINICAAGKGERPSAHAFYIDETEDEIYRADVDRDGKLKVQAGKETYTGG